MIAFKTSCYIYASFIDISIKNFICFYLMFKNILVCTFDLKQLLGTFFQFLFSLKELFNGKNIWIKLQSFDFPICHNELLLKKLYFWSNVSFLEVLFQHSFSLSMTLLWRSLRNRVAGWFFLGWVQLLLDLGHTYIRDYFQCLFLLDGDIHCHQFVLRQNKLQILHVLGWSQAFDFLQIISQLLQFEA